MIDLERAKDNLYLYSLGYYGEYRVGKIRKINTKTVTMDCNVKIPKEDFEKHAYKLTDTEVAIYREEIIKCVSGSSKAIRKLNYNLHLMRELLNKNEYVTLDRDKLQKDLEDAIKLLNLELNKAIKINDSSFQLQGNSTTILKEV